MNCWQSLATDSFELAPSLASSLIVESSRKLVFDIQNYKRGIEDKELYPGVSNIFLDPISYSTDA